MIDSDSQDSVPSKKRVNKGGPKSIIQLFPSIIDKTSEFLKQHGLAAQCRRRNDTGFSSGVIINQIRQHLLENVQGLREHISKFSFRGLFKAYNKSQNAAARYNGHIVARVGTKFNSYRESHIDAHHLFARKKFCREFISMFPCSVSILSTDDMAKIKVGPPAVSQYHQVRKMFMKDDNMNLPDYGFPIPRYLLNTLGYMWLQITLKIKLLSATFSHQHHSTLQMKMINSNMDQ